MMNGDAHNILKRFADQAWHLPCTLLLRNRIRCPRPRGGAMLARIGGTVRFKEPLSFHTSLRIGGLADFFIMPQSLDDIRYAVAFAHQEDLPVVLLGGGNNVLISDQGLQAVVLKLSGMFGR